MPNIVELLLVLVDQFPSLQELPPGQVKDTYELIARYAPTVAREPILVGPFIRDVIRLGHFDLTVMQKLCELEVAMYNAAGDADEYVRFAVVADEAGNLLAEGDLKLLMRNVATRLKISEDEVVQILDAAEQETAHVR